jgi:regulation of enolase protein 1 (concanavalin A-like superfamily)
MELELKSGKWLNKPPHCEISESSVEITTEQNTDFWQRSYYGFRNDNAPALLFTSNKNFTFSVKVAFKYNQQFDQCGLIIYIDSDHWFKASIEYENSMFSRLGSVVTNFGYSDWATSDIILPAEIGYRLSRRGPDFLIEYSLDGNDYKQMRIFHLHALGETTEEMGKVNPPIPAKNAVPFGIYACSPAVSSFSARFTHFKFEPCRWLAHRPA